MANKFTMTHEFDCTVETFWSKVMFDKEMNEGLFKQALAFPEFNVLELRETDSEVFRRTISTPKMDVPGPVAKALGSSFKFTDELRYDKKARKATFKGIPSTMAEKLLTSGTIQCTDLPNGRCRRVIEVTVEAKIFAIGGLFESTAEANMRKAYDTGAVYMNKWIAQKGLKA
ncbi:MAG: DUF2505 family protein [Deltaproteobacteria bacterium]|jgi:hypothetical protein|nr:DUF2505 family protein [Deltaproteobacteria bacterium]